MFFLCQKYQRQKGGRVYDFKRRGDSASEKNGYDGCG